MRRVLEPATSERWASAAEYGLVQLHAQGVRACDQSPQPGVSSVNGVQLHVQGVRACDSQRCRKEAGITVVQLHAQGVRACDGLKSM